MGARGLKVTGKPTAFHGSLQLDSLHVERDADKVAQEIIQHLTSLMGAEVTLTLDISARIPDGMPDTWCGR
jgi:hypothetical protein